MSVKILFVTVVLFDFVRIHKCTNLNPIRYLVKYGYTFGNAFSGNQLDLAIKTFQKFAGIPQTGLFDNATLNMMKKPRCGLPDRNLPSVLFAVPKVWQKHHLTYYLENYSPDITQNKIEEIIVRAFKVWSDVSILSFQKVDEINADIIIKFAKGDHGDLFSFDGPGNALAHAFAPPYGDVHFDDDETFTHNSNTGVNLFWVAVHEFGHALGLDHTSVKGAVMHQYYADYQPNFKLHADDIYHINRLYKVVPTQSVITLPTVKPVCKNNERDKLCNAWKSRGHCVNYPRVRLECMKECKVCT